MTGPDGERVGAADRGGLRSRLGALAPDLAVLGGLLLLAAVLRLVDLPTRGTWDADQGNDMLALRSFVRDGVVPLLGPPTSIGDFHHGAMYYWLLVPAAFVGRGDDPIAVVAAIALGGTAAVGVTWWLGRDIAGRLAGGVAGLLLAVSATAVSGSTFIWNPNIVALTGSLALATTWLAWSRRQPAWWLAAGATAALTMHGHVLGAVLMVPLAVVFLADVRRRPGERRRILGWGVAALAVVAATYLPLLVSELGHDFGETRALFAWLVDGEGSGDALAILGRLFFVPLRVVAWPLVGAVLDAPIAAVAAFLLVLILAAWRLRVAPDPERAGVRWLVAALAICTLLLAFGAGGLGSVTPLPVDHYHAFLDPATVLLVGIGVAALWRTDMTGRVIAMVAVAGLVAWNVAHLPPAIAPDGGWPAAQTAGDRLVTLAAGRPIALVGIPDFKPTTAYQYPLARSDVELVEPDGATVLAVLCDDMFAEVVGAACGGPAEERAAAEQAGEWSLLERFSPAPGRTLSVYERAGG
jgi:4-amino-4-deoxy-L-arabinose transferase-like glycosyltransferase